MQVEECIEVNLEELRRGMKRGILNKQNVEESREKGQRRRISLSAKEDEDLMEKGEKRMKHECVVFNDSMYCFNQC